MAKQTIDIGAAANDGGGDPLRTAFDKINDNFDELYDALSTIGSAAPASAGAAGEPGQVAYDTDYFYVCVAADTWKRTALASW